MVCWDSKVHNSASFLSFFFFFFFLLLLLLLTISRSGRLAEIRRSVYISKSQCSLYVSFSWTDSGFCIYHLLEWSNFNFLHNSQFGLGTMVMKVTLYFSKLWHDWSLTIKLFSVISGHSLGGWVLPLSRNTVGVFYSQLGWKGFVLYPGHLLWGGLTPLQRCSRCILQPKPTKRTWNRL